MSARHDPAEAIGQVTHYFSHRSVAAVRLSAPLALGDKIHIRGHTTDLVQNVADRKSTRLNSSHIQKSRMPSSA